MLKIGITYDLRSRYIAEGYSEEDVIEFDSDSTVYAIENSINSLGYVPDHIGNIKDLVNRLSKGDKWDLVFNIAEGMHGFSRESQIPNLLDAYNIPYTFSDSHVLALSLNKDITKRVLSTHSIPIADWTIVSNIKDIDEKDIDEEGVWNFNGYPLFIKPVFEGTSKGITSKSIVHNWEEFYDVCKDLLFKYNQPVLVEDYLDGREFTVGILGTGKESKAIGCLEIIINNKDGFDKEIYSYKNKKQYEEVIEYRLVEDDLSHRALEIALITWEVLGCRDAGRVDLRADKKGNLYVLEVNPLSGLNPIYSDLCILCNKIGMTYTELIKQIIESALKRNGLR
jgi:D-alanine-D-alanine ligase